MALAIQEFILAHADWEAVLAEKPYCLTTTHAQKNGRNLVMLKYSQIDSDFNNPIVRECRGIVLDINTLEVVSHAFDKFGNYGEGYADKIDWNNAHVTQKIDGSLIKIAKLDDGILVSTNGTIDAFAAPLSAQSFMDCPAETFGGLVMIALKDVMKNLLDKDASDDDVLAWLSQILEKDTTYMFELTSPFNRVIVRWDKISLTFLGQRNNKTNKEVMFKDSPLASIFKTPEVYNISSLESCVAAADALGHDEEGFVVVDSCFHRVKVKSPLYVAMHHLRGENGVMSDRRAVEIARRNDVDEVANYFPEFTAALINLKDKILRFQNHERETWNEFSKLSPSLETRKDKACWITSHSKFPAIMFALLDGKAESVTEIIRKMPADVLVKVLKSMK